VMTTRRRCLLIGGKPQQEMGRGKWERKTGRGGLVFLSHFPFSLSHLSVIPTS
jgi:hypothetical protein